MASDVKRLLANWGYCLNCGEETPKSARGYCSKECHSEKPPVVVELERKYKKPIRQIVVEALNSNPTQREAGGVLRVSTTTINKWIKKYDIEQITYFE